MDIKDVLDPLVSHGVSLHDESGQKRDIEKYIESIVNARRINKMWRPKDKKLVVDVLTENADGM